MMKNMVSQEEDLVSLLIHYQYSKNQQKEDVHMS